MKLLKLRSKLTGDGIALTLQHATISCDARAECRCSLGPRRTFVITSSPLLRDSWRETGGVVLTSSLGEFRQGLT